jgi:hypothetical protein
MSGKVDTSWDIAFSHSKGSSLNDEADSTHVSASLQEGLSTDIQVCADLLCDEGGCQDVVFDEMP